MKEAVKYSRENDRRWSSRATPCVIDRAAGGKGEFIPVEITSECDGLRRLRQTDSSAALVYHDEDKGDKHTTIDRHAVHRLRGVRCTCAPTGRPLQVEGLKADPAEDNHAPCGRDRP